MNRSDLTQAVDGEMTGAEKLFQALRERTADAAAGGVTRPSYGPGEQAAHDLMAEAAGAVGLEIATDFAGNLYMTLPGRERGAPAWIAGSHLDSVPSGGNFDGAAGVIAGLSALAAFRRSGFVPVRDVTVMGVRAEETSSWFKGRHGTHFGSRAALGRLDPGELDRAVRLDTGRTLGEHIRDAGFDVEALRAGRAYLDPKRIHGYIELHIEQGPVLERERFPVGVVTGIRGTVRARDCACFGTYTHSGAVPHEYRADAVLATVEFVAALDREWETVRDAGGDLVFTVGKLYTDARVHGLSKVPGEARFCLDIRSDEPAVLARMARRAETLAADIGRRRRVRFELGPVVFSDPAVMHVGLRRRLLEGCRELEIPALEIASGAGHDAADFAHAGVPSAMIFVRNAHGSHNPEEDMQMADFALGTRLLAWMLADAR